MTEMGIFARQALRRFWIAPLAFALFVAAGLAYVAMTEYKAEPAGSARASESSSQSRSLDGRFYPSDSEWATLTVTPVDQIVFRSELRTEGKIAIDERHATKIYAPYPGRIRQLAVEPGDVVKRDQLLFTVEAADSVEAQKNFVAAITDVNKAQSRVTLTRIVEQRMANLVKDKAMPMKDFEEAQANYVTAQNDLRAAEIALQAVRNRLSMLGKTAEEIAVFEKSGTISADAPVYSPLSGTVLQRNVGPGQYINAGASDTEPVFRIGDISKVWLVAYIREADAASVKVGQPIRFQVLAHPGRVFEAKINYVTSTLDPTSRRLLVRAPIDNSEGLLKPEMFANVTIVVTDESNATVAIPREAVIYEADKARVWVAVNGRALEMREVELGLANGDMIQVRKGLNPGDRVVSRGSLFIDRMSVGS